MQEHFAGALDTVNDVTLPPRMPLVERPETVRAVHDRLAELQRTLSTGVVCLLGVLVGFSDTYGTERASSQRLRRRSP